jgi:hypothetical protein
MGTLVSGQCSGGEISSFPTSLPAALSCQNGGTCVADICSCPYGWSGAFCHIFGCPHQCLNGGTCTAVDVCACTPGWTGPTCGTSLCAPSCGIHGNCSSAHSCLCGDGWSGSTCSTPPSVINNSHRDGVDIAYLALSIGLVIMYVHAARRFVAPHALGLQGHACVGPAAASRPITLQALSPPTAARRHSLFTTKLFTSCRREPLTTNARADPCIPTAGDVHY